MLGIRSCEVVSSARSTGDPWEGRRRGGKREKRRSISVSTGGRGKVKEEKGGRKGREEGGWSMRRGAWLTLLLLLSAHTSTQAEIHPVCLSSSPAAALSLDPRPPSSSFSKQEDRGDRGEREKDEEQEKQKEAVALSSPVIGHKAVTGRGQ